MTLIMTNLVENAIKYNKDHGWVKVELDADHQYFTFRVSDSGVGIPEDALAHIYDRFYRVDKSHSREIGGTGLGLAITKSAVLVHRGTITVTSKEGQGSSFSVRIPLFYTGSWGGCLQEGREEWTWGSWFVFCWSYYARRCLPAAGRGRTKAIIYMRCTMWAIPPPR